MCERQARGGASAAAAEVDAREAEPGGLGLSTHLPHLLRVTVSVKGCLRSHLPHRLDVAPRPQRAAAARREGVRRPALGCQSPLQPLAQLPPADRLKLARADEVHPRTDHPLDKQVTHEARVLRLLAILHAQDQVRLEAHSPCGRGGGAAVVGLDAAHSDHRLAPALESGSQ
eukprot:scaffold36074_cov60-Phaeocystis_antarctica.AAC.2